MDFIQTLTIYALPILFAITVHEAAHGYIAARCGDKTALMLGRVTLNPLKHIDIIGTIIVPVIMLLTTKFIFGWAKPVPVTWQNLRNPRRDMALVAIAGPGANLVMALLWAIVMKLASMYALNSEPAKAFYLMGNAGIIINLFLMFLNLLPVPPLDGSRVVTSLLSARTAYFYNSLEPYGIIILLILLLTRVLGTILLPPLIWLYSFILHIFSIPQIQ